MLLAFLHIQHNSKLKRGVIISFWLEPFATTEEVEGNDNNDEDKAHYAVECVWTSFERKGNIHSVDAGDDRGEGENDCKGSEKANCFIELVCNNDLN